MSAGQSPRAPGPQRAPPIVLLVGCPPGFVAACLKEARRLGVAARECDAASVASGDRPFAVIVAEGAYQERPHEIEELTREAGVALLRIDAQDLRRPGCEHPLAAAIIEAAASRDEGDACG